MKVYSINIKILILIFLSSASTLQQKQLENNLISWNSERKLKWSDFLGEVPKSKYLATTYTTIRAIPITYCIDSLQYNITSDFLCDESWTKDRVSVSLLAHEQLHFDISELAARKIRKEYSEYNLMDLKTSYKKLSDIFKKYSTSFLDSMEIKYDKETNHGVNLEIQLLWEKKIKKELNDLSRFKSMQVVVKKR